MKTIFFGLTMMKTRLYYICLLLILVISCKNPDNSGLSKIEKYNIPLLNKAITIDGLDSDWKNQGFEGRLFSNEWGEMVNDSSLLVTFKMGWTKSGIYIAINVKDDTLVVDTTRNIWNGDGIEIFYQEMCGKSNKIQFAIAPPTVSNKQKLRVDTFDYRDGNLKGSNSRAKIAAKSTISGYIIEALLPFSELGINPIEGLETALQIYVHDCDRIDGPVKSLNWNSMTGSYINPYAFQRIVLSENGSNPYDIAVKGFVVDDSYGVFRFAGIEKYFGSKYNIISKGNILYQGSIGKSGGIATSTAVINLPLISDSIRINIENAHSFDFDLKSITRTYINKPRPNAYEPDIRLFELSDKETFPEAGAILFTGSSTIRMWTTLSSDMSGMPVINRGFGGSTMKDLLYFINRIVIPYKPCAIVCYEGTNDITSGITAEALLKNFEEFIRIVQSKLPETQIFILSPKPCVARKYDVPVLNKANELLKQLALKNSHITFLNIVPVAFDKAGKLRSDNLLPDMTHMNRKGYNEVTSIIKPIIQNYYKNKCGK